jgi:hypothetical protein
MPTELLAYAEFAKLRLAQFLRRDPVLLSEVASRQGWEFMGGTWIGEGLGFTEFLRLERMPHELGCVSVDLASLPNAIGEAILNRLGLPLRHGMVGTEVDAQMGAPERQHAFVADRESFDYTVGRAWPYHVGCTVHDRDGLIYLVMARKDVLALCEPDEAPDA